MSDDHFTVDGTLIQAWASQKSFKKKDGSDDDGTNFHGDQRSNDTHESTTDPDARLYKKSYGKESHLAYLGHALVENRNGLIAAAMVTQADVLSRARSRPADAGRQAEGSYQAHYGRSGQGPTTTGSSSRPRASSTSLRTSPQTTTEGARTWTAEQRVTLAMRSA